MVFLLFYKIYLHLCTEYIQFIIHLMIQNGGLNGNYIKCIFYN